MKLLVKRIPGQVLPFYASTSSAGLDIRCTERFVLKPGERKLAKTGLFVALKDSPLSRFLRWMLSFLGWKLVYQIEVRPRSGLALKQGLTVLNAPGTIDEDYRGEIGVILINHSDKEVVIDPGERIAQLVVGTALRVEVVFADELGKTQRGSGGFGSTGLH